MRPRSDTLLVWTGGPCSYGCPACPIDQRIASAGLQLADLQRGLANTAASGRLVVFVGGEPFLRQDILRLITAVRVAGGAPGIITTGRVLLYPQLRDRLRRSGLAYLRVQFFGTGELHDREVGVPGAFEQAIAGLRAWLSEASAQCDVDAALSTRRRSIETVGADIEELARQIPSPDVQILVAVDPADAPVHSSDAVRRAVAAFEHWNEDSSRPLLAWEGLPPSVRVRGSMTVRPLRPQFVGIVPRACCLGAVRDIATAAAADDAETRANSFNYVRGTTTVPWVAEAAACTAHTAAGGLDPARHLWLIQDERLVLYATDTGDFDAAEVSRVKDQLSHVFLDRAPAGVLDDFTEGMRRILPDITCERCDHRTRCGRRFEIVEGPPYAREEAWIADQIARLRGAVLDVGCGEQLYRDELEPLVRSGVVQYTGLDPDEVSLAALRAALPEGDFHVGEIEDFQGRAASYDHIMSLRSLNHVVDLDEALARMAWLLKPGGSLLLVECTPFAMLRRAEQVAAADRAPRAGHQHMRNVASGEVLPFARRHGLRVLHHHQATLETTNEWILLLAKPGE